MANSEVEPFGVLLRRLREERELTQEGLAFAMHSAGNGGATSGAIGQFERGVTRPRPETIEAIARGLQVEPEVFAEYRLLKLRELFDPSEVGLDEAIANARELSAALGGEGLPDPPGELGRRLKAALPNGTGPAPADRRRAARAGDRRQRA